MLIYIHLAWLQLVHFRLRFVATLIGIAFVTVLLFMQLGFQDALFDSSVRIYDALQGDLFMISPQYKSLTAQQYFPRLRLYQSLALEDVESVRPLYSQFAKLKNIENGEKFSIFVFGIDPGQSAFKLLDINQNLNQIKLPKMALFDRKSRSEFGPITEKFKQEKKVEIEIAPYNEITLANRFQIGGLFTIGTSFGVDGNIIVNYSSFLHIFPDQKAGDINIGLINLKAGTNLLEIRDKLVQGLPSDIKILTRQELMNLEKEYWDLRTPVGFAFRIMVTMGFIIGIGVSYQILYTNISSHIIEYATLKAIGFSNNYLSNIVFKQAVLLAIIGYIPGLIISIILYEFTEQSTRLPVMMTLDKIIIIMVSILLMCSVSGIVAIQKLRSADPADIFG